MHLVLEVKAFSAGDKEFSAGDEHVTHVQLNSLQVDQVSRKKQ